MSICTTTSNSSPKVSVIIPIYNTELYLRESLNSICNQTLQELEIILINDGSIDNSQSIIEEYALRDVRVRYIIQPNQGQGVARNNGLQLATGQYIYFMDSDDILDTDALYQCFKVCEQNKLDFVFFDADTIVEDYNTSTAYKYCKKGIISENKFWNGIELLNYELEYNVLSVSPCLFFTNHAYLKKNFSGFPSNIIHEDHIFAMQIMLNAKSVHYIAQPYFKRRMRANSTMTTSFSMRNIEGYTTVCTQIRDWTQKHEEWTSSINLYLTKTLNAVIWESHKMYLIEKIETICRFQRLKLTKYVTFKNWMVFWFKKRKNM